MQKQYFYVVNGFFFFFITILLLYVLLSSHTNETRTSKKPTILFILHSFVTKKTLMKKKRFTIEAEKFFFRNELQVKFAYAVRITSTNCNSISYVVYWHDDFFPFNSFDDRRRFTLVTDSVSYHSKISQAFQCLLFIQASFWISIGDLHEFHSHACLFLCVCVSVFWSEIVLIHPRCQIIVCITI